MKVKTKTAVILFWEEETQTPRQILFGNPGEILNLLDWADNLKKRMVQLMLKAPESKDEMVQAIEETSPTTNQLNQGQAFEDTSHIELSWEVKE